MGPGLPQNGLQPGPPPEGLGQHLGPLTHHDPLPPPVLSVPGQLADAGDEGIGSACNTLHRSSNRLLGGECHNIPAESLPVCCIVDISMGRGPGHAPYRLRLDPA